jgi:hypothetical protein
MAVFREEELGSWDLEESFLQNPKHDIPYRLRALEMNN